MGRVQLDAGKSCVDKHLGTPCKACDYSLDIFLGHGVRLTELPARQPKLDGRGRLGTRIYNFLALPARVADLRPKMVPAAGPSGGPRLQGGLHRSRRLAIDDDITRALQMISIDLHIARQQEACAAVAPYAIQLVERRRGLSGRGSPDPSVIAALHSRLGISAPQGSVQ